MATQTIISLAGAVAALDALLLLLNTGGAGSIEVRTGPAPANPEAADSGTLLATLPLSADAFGGAASDAPNKWAEADAASITSDASADADGTAAHFRAKNGSGTVVIQGTVGTSDADMILNTVAIVLGATVSVASWQVRLPTGQA